MASRSGGWGVGWTRGQATYCELEKVEVKWRSEGEGEVAAGTDTGEVCAALG